MVAGRAAGELERLDSEAALQRSLSEKEVLLQEVHHRVKNNLAAIKGLLDIVGHTIDNEYTKVTLIDLSSRIDAMALVHEQLYQSDDFSQIAMQEYLRVLIDHIRSSYELSNDIQIRVLAEEVELGLDTAVPCGLLITELLTNAFKYAFPSKQSYSGSTPCRITIMMEWDGTAYTLTVSDNGVGLPGDLDWTETETLGMMLVRMISEQQLQGKIEWDCTNGTTFQLRF